MECSCQTMPRLKCHQCKIKKDEDEDFYNNSGICKDCKRANSAIFKDTNRVHLKATLQMMAEQQDNIHCEIVRQRKINQELVKRIEDQDEQLKQIRKMLKKMSTK